MLTLQIRVSTVSRMKIKIFQSVVLFFLTIIFYAWGLATVQYKYFPYTFLVAIQDKLFQSGEPIISDEENAYWANEIRKGGFTLYFRHSQRNKQPLDLIVAYDTLELVTGVNNSGSTCLGSQGKKDAKLIGEIFEINGVNVGNIISSPLCRSKEMAEIAFGEINEIENSFVYRPLFNSSEYQTHSEKIKKALIKHSPNKDKNTIVLAHTSTLEHYAKDIFKSYDEKIINEIDESGFYVIQNIGGDLFLKHKFKSFSDYVYGLQLLSTYLK